MKKELIICAVVIALVVILNIVTDKHTETVMGEVTSGLDEVREKLIAKDETDLVEKMDSIIDNWLHKSDGLAYYVEHEELEKVEMYLWEIDSNIETKEYNIAVQSLDTCEFIIEHIKDKYKFSLKNIF